ncbi:MAG: hypothetical protein NTU98_12010 [Bacteroidetes bacterium]|nr:hypothetical protein [Bacteroidota bacterium]
MKTIKTKAIKTLFIIALISGLQITLVYAKSSAENSPASKNSFLTSLAPVTPTRADFDDPVPEKAPAMVCIAPETPKEATFTSEDSSPSESPEFLKALAPSTPPEADFNDSDPSYNTDQVLVLSHPDVPVEASFDDN